MNKIIVLLKFQIDIQILVISSYAIYIVLYYYRNYHTKFEIDIQEN